MTKLLHGTSTPKRTHTKNATRAESPLELFVKFISTSLKYCTFV